MNIRSLAAAMHVSLMGIVFGLLPASAATGCPEGVTEEVNGTCIPTGTGLSSSSVMDILQTLMFWLFGIFGMLAVIAFVISGIQYLTAAGNDKQIETAKNNMQYSIIGVIVALSGLVIVTAIGTALTGQDTAF